ncbi:ABC transporter ATP-binding protein [Actinomadura mexicana]|uniref:ABC-type dipeptide/oligopeptide/nickel transport system, ATPase component n=1 Tax=Actinomadura mexicana TaxID=134959 RepID=A0A238X083_9ACTN|nr:ABC transporter ATP-binding protein [Actinomadura mexicana]SNR51259.1 ABC-type dipeptide/oligopeptide/nickel transport system, ATPase component [Actinomadura mexicana]
MKAVLTAENLRVRAGDRLLASLDELSVGPGECAAIVGESGSGKTTALNAMLGLTDGLRVSGKVVVNGTDVVTADDRTLSKLRGSVIALVSQSPQASLNPTMRLGALLKRVLARHGLRGAEARERTEEALRSVLLDPGLLRRYPHQVSGGQAQRFAIAMAVALRADVILADEPTSALDVTVQAAVLDLLARLRDEHGIALVFVSHDLAVVSGIADHVVVMRQGSVVEAGPAADVLQSPSAAYTRELLDAVPAIGE